MSRPRPALFSLALLLGASLGCGAAGTRAEPIDAGFDADANEPALGSDFRDQSLYLVMLDRFDNGDTGNDLAGNADCLRPESAQGFHGGDLAGLARRLDYLQELGVTSVWTTPLYEANSCGSHGYWPNFELGEEVDLEPKFGSEAELDSLIASLEARDMQLYLDMVVNHAGYGAPIVHERPSWFHSESDCESGPEETQCELSGLPDFAHEKSEVADYLRDVSRAWADRFAIGGIRMDTAKHVPLGYFRDTWLPAMREARPGLHSIAEVYDESDASALAPYLAAGFSSAFHFPLRRSILETLGRKNSLDGLAGMVRESIETLGIDAANRLTNFLANHDVPRWTDAIDMSMSDEEALARYKLAMVATLTLPGVPQIYAGDELCLRGSWPDNRRDMPAWSWSAQTRAGSHPESLGDGQECFALTAALLGLRAEEEALRRGRYVELWSQGGGPPVYAFYRARGESRIIVLLHAGQEATGELHIPLRDNPGMSPSDREALAEGVALEAMLGEEALSPVHISGGQMRLSLPPMSATIYRVLAP